jgi:hypothetical protein
MIARELADGFASIGGPGKRGGSRGQVVGAGEIKEGGEQLTLGGFAGGD